MRRFEKILLCYVVFFVALSIALIASRPHLGQFLRDVRLGNALAKCESLYRAEKVIGQRCVPRFDPLKSQLSEAP